MSEHQDDRGWWLLNAPTLPWRLWPLIRDRHSTLSDALQRLFGDDEAVKLALAPNIAYYTDDPDTMPFVFFAIPQASYLLGGGHYIRGGSQVLSDRLVAIVREAGGACEATRDASAILLEGDRVCGVRHHARDAQDSQEDIAPIVFGNAAPSERARRFAAGAGAPKLQRTLR
jgi:all-trans-retinol 13,14-reductase